MTRQITQKKEVTGGGESSQKLLACSAATGTKGFLSCTTQGHPMRVPSWLASKKATGRPKGPGRGTVMTTRRAVESQARRHAPPQFSQPQRSGRARRLPSLVPPRDPTKCLKKPCPPVVRRRARPRPHQFSSWARQTGPGWTPWPRLSQSPAQTVPARRTPRTPRPPRGVLRWSQR